MREYAGDALVLRIIRFNTNYTYYVLILRYSYVIYLGNLLTTYQEPMIAWGDAEEVDVDLGCRQLASHQVPAGWGCEWLLEAAAANAEEVGTYLAQCGVW